MAKRTKLYSCNTEEQSNVTETVCKDNYGKIISCEDAGEDATVTTIASETKNPACITIDELVKKGHTPNIVPPRTGLFNTAVLDESVNFQAPLGSNSTKYGDAYITLSSDMPSGLLSGFGGKGAKKASTIDLVVGRMASVNDGAGPGPTKTVGNNFFADAARIYISQLTNVDKNFGLALSENKGHTGAAIGIKADAVRIIGREGIKIVTGKAQGVKLGPSGELNSRGGKISRPAPTIELIAGNNIEPRTFPGGKFRKGKTTINTLQPVVLGENTRDCVQELGNIVNELASTMFNMALLQQGVNTALGITPIAAHAAAVGAAAPLNLQTVIGAIHSIRANKMTWELNYTNAAGYKYICSENVKTT